MTKTRASMDPSETLLTLEDVPKSRKTKSPSPKKRKIDPETPTTDQFVDARATPFTQRKKSKHIDLTEGETQDEEAYETADEETTDSIGSSSNTSHTLQASPVSTDIITNTATQVMLDGLRLPSSTNIGRKDQLELEIHTTNGQRASAPDLDHASTHTDGYENESDNEAPDAVSNVKVAEVTKAAESARLDSLKRGKEATKQKRRKRDEKLKKQKQESRSKELLVTPVDPEELEEEENQVVPISKPVIPRFLPDEVLHADTELISEPSETNLNKLQGKHQTFKIPKPKTKMKKGPLTVRVLSKQRFDMAPKKSAQIADVKDAWLYKRRHNSSQRRPITKSLA